MSSLDDAIKELAKEVDEVTQNSLVETENIEKETAYKHREELVLLARKVDDIIPQCYAVSENEKLPEKYRSEFKEIASALSRNARDFGLALNLYDASIQALNKLNAYRVILREHPEKVKELAKDPLLYDFFKRAGKGASAEDAYKKMMSTLKYSVEKLGPAAQTLNSYLRRLDEIIPHKEQGLNNAKSLTVLVPLLAGFAFLGTVMRNPREFVSGVSGYAASVTEPVTLFSLISTIAIITFFLVYFKKVPKIRQ